ncbi:DUF948 domain-containing protein [Lentibacillus sp.]|jgi:uncharacterized protein YoxC|uniref:DUF948 domain-containing protein n=1 Tax=Lentibacillus sp. TaxID=1925746 RepID=UPI002B4B46AA|nr:DUF948 domain-containing protein [Lentibacillus sp.]HLS07840.1 DUF948 domain-containing protein [Lentibacillus sp.]
MDWAGLGVIIIGLAMLGLVFLLVKPLKSLTKVLANLQNTTNDLPNQMTEIMTGLKNTLSSANEAIRQLNEQFGKIAPIFQIIGNIGTSLQNLFRVMANINEEMRQKTDNPMMEHYHLEGIYGVMALGYSIYQRRKTKK